VRQASTNEAKDRTMNMQLSLAPIIALLAGILILVQPRLLNYIVAIYLIVIGLLGLFGGAGGLHMH
jgi:threonine/homoserine efflux transporter RhtA